MSLKIYNFLKRLLYFLFDVVFLFQYFFKNIFNILKILNNTYYSSKHSFFNENQHHLCYNYAQLLIYIFDWISRNTRHDLSNFL